MYLFKINYMTSVCAIFFFCLKFDAWWEAILLMKWLKIGFIFINQTVGRVKAMDNSGRKLKYKTGSMFCKDVNVFPTSDHDKMSEHNWT